MDWYGGERSGLCVKFSSGGCSPAQRPVQNVGRNFARRHMAELVRFTFNQTEQLLKLFLGHPDLTGNERLNWDHGDLTIEPPSRNDGSSALSNAMSMTTLMSRLPGGYPTEPQTRTPFRDYLRHMTRGATSFTLERDIYPFLARLGIHQDDSTIPELIQYANVLINREADDQWETRSSSTSQTQESN